MDNFRPILSICIPSYNRPEELIRLLYSIDFNYSNDIEIIICEDKSPLRKEISEKISQFNQEYNSIVKYFENESNLGYDANLIELIRKSSGEYIIYMGDDDKFITNNFGNFIEFLKCNRDLGYILRRYSIIHEDGSIEEFKYYPKTTFFESGTKAFAELVRKSVFISGFCFKKDYVLNFYDTNSFNGTLLYQLFLCGELALNYKTAYCDVPISIMNLNERGKPEFGSSENEKNIYEPGNITLSNSINFMKSFFKITSYFDKKYSFDFSKVLKMDISKYSYPVLAIHRDKGVSVFRKYNKMLINEININISIYYYVYYYSLLIFGKRKCDKIILMIKYFLNGTPRL